jgi:hypothetical protein
MTAAFGGIEAAFSLRLEEISLLYKEVFLKRGFCDKKPAHQPLP